MLSCNEIVLVRTEHLEKYRLGERSQAQAASRSTLLLTRAIISFPAVRATISVFAQATLWSQSRTAAGDRFPPTRWSVVHAARSADLAQQARAQDTLFAAY